MAFRIRDGLHVWYRSAGYHWRLAGTAKVVDLVVTNQFTSWSDCPGPNRPEYWLVIPIALFLLDVDCGAGSRWRNAPGSKLRSQELQKPKAEQSLFEALQSVD